MTTRADMIETAARAWHDATCPEGPECRDHRLHADPHSIPVMGQLVDVLDAVLPQITTAEQLEALPDWSVALDDQGQAWTRVPEGWQHLACGPVSAHTVRHYGPLTVVWQPQPDQETRADA